MIRKSINEYDKNVFDEFSNKWALLTVGGKEKYNCMTVSWGAMGVLWNKKIGIIFVRHSRHSYDILESTERFTLSFFDEKYQDALKKCGSISGRDADKFKEANLTPIYDVDFDLYYAKEANYVMKFKKLYYQDIDPNKILDPSILTNCYPTLDLHRMYVGEITQFIESEGEND